MEKTVWSVDLGASSGRLVEVNLKDGKLFFELVYRFDNTAMQYGNKQIWDTQNIFSEILQAMKKASDRGSRPASVAIDSFGVDYLLLDHDNQPLAPAIAYRDRRTLHLPDKLEQLEGLSLEKLYDLTGIQVLELNTFFQLLAQKYEDSSLLKKCCKFLFFSDYFNFLLCGRMANEYTQATTSQLLSTVKHAWVEELLSLVELKSQQFAPLCYPGEQLGYLSMRWQKLLNGIAPKIILPPSHDTSSAVAACPASGDQDWAFISSGTWSLLGCELAQPLINPEVQKANFSNEGGANGTTFLKNIIGMWLLQLVHEEEKRYSYAELESMALSCPKVDSYINPSAAEFYNPSEPISKVVQLYCQQHQQPAPQNLPQLLRLIYQSLALLYSYELKRLEKLTGKTFQCLYIVGGGCQSNLLNQLTADSCQITVYAGPKEATSLGNAIVQLASLGAIRDLQEGRSLIAQSVEIKKFTPRTYPQAEQEIFSQFAHEGF